ncbi:MAG: glycosyl transferase family 2 [Gammaproteobacteria bacterium RIFCSPHIGHO2_12_FULL_35_23]|nr:MAG: glycosyl transferase family 2 [Gammaproteobacteria bacterium RIFCSPHIGHO2_12_FULL_35_23]
MNIDRKLLVDNQTLFISFVVPIYNEAVNIKDFIKALTQSANKLSKYYEIVIINDGSTDNSLAVIETELLPDSHIKLISFSRNFGKEIALTAGLHHCRGQIAILIDADFQHPLASIPEFIERWTEDYDMVYGLRDNRSQETFLKRFFARIFYKTLGFLSDTKIPADAGDFRLLDRKVVDAINSCKEYNRFMKGLYAWVGFKATAVIYPVLERQGGKTSFSFLKLAELALTGIFSFSDMPLRVWSLIGILISGISLLYALVIVFDTLCFGVDVPGFATITVAIMFFGGIQLISIGILGEYIARIFREVKNRPKYIIDKTHGFENE